ncbi:recombinase RecA [Candidatus Beckwithbacteria bacterium RIFCSPLOWO2_02_FULL_47_23]|uniref:Protein RecA n=2 Tax=Candidatus Beckwithiibacteriota TaxID=1752726 RepID=A0A1F5E383_9BACT|nr:MAG: recombinase RecA [Candidatus Beckwithbacteria bacterium RIFCSPHIGHO2_12_FULL_47_17]OGD61877.1 MAG: recombinase RecA [Candidatus Beckwithbacteria bacterium RIFCSPLOWO2_02_FULL_47_23]
MADNPKLQAIKVAMEQIQKEYGAGAIMKLGDRTHLEVSTIPTGSLALDIALGVGGLPRGRITEIFGPEASGKTTLCLHVIAEAQKAGGTAAFIDAEHALDPQRAETIGVKLDDLLISQPDTGEQALEIAETLIRSGAIDVICVDSVAALVPKAEIEGEMGDSMMGLQARLMSQAMRKLTSAIAKSKAVIIFTNQLRMKIGVMFGNPETTTGGKALKFYASIRLDCRKIGNIQDGEKIVGSRHRIKVVKNKVAAPFRVCELDILNVGGISRMGDLIDLAVLNGVIEKSGSFFRFKGEVIGQGKEAVREYLGENHKLAKEIEVDVWQKIKADDKQEKHRGRPKKTTE